MRLAAPMLRLLLPLAAGIAIAAWVSLPITLLWAIIAAALIATTLSTFIFKPLLRSSWFFNGSLTILFVGIGAILVQLHDPLSKNSHFTHAIDDGELCQVMLKLIDTPQEKERTYKSVAEVTAVRKGDTTLATSGKVMLYIAKEAGTDSLRYGDILVAICRMNQPSGQENPFQFDYRQYLRRKGILRQAYLPVGQYSCIGNDSHGLIGWSKDIQRKLVGRIRESHLNSAQQGIAEALLLGWKNDIDDQTQQQFRNAGITHLLCVSGLHVGLVAAIIGGCLAFMRRRRTSHIIAKAIQMAGIWLFVLVTGMAPATLRAGIMFSLFVVGDLMGRRSNSLNTLATSAFLLLCINPQLLFDVGWQLSHTAVLGIILLYRPLTSLIPLEKLEWRLNNSNRKVLGHLVWPLRKVWELATLSTAAQVGTLPLTIFYFHQFPTYFLIANITIVPFAGLLLTTILFVVLTTWSESLCLWGTKVLSAELGATDAITRWVSELPYATIDNIYSDIPLLILGFATLASTICLLRSRKHLFIPLTLLGLFLIKGYRQVINHHAEQQSHWIIYADTHHTAIEVFKGRESFLICDTGCTTQTFDYVSHNLLNHNRTLHRTLIPFTDHITSDVVTVNQHQIDVSGTTFNIVNRETWNSIRHGSTLDTPTPVSFLILTGNPYLTIEELTNHYTFDTLVIAAENVPWRTDQWKQGCESLGIPCHDIRTLGAIYR